MRGLTQVKKQYCQQGLTDLIPNKILNIGTFRSSFVSYYYPKSNNQEKQIMKTPMRIFIDERNRAYLKYYQSPETLVKVK